MNKKTLILVIDGCAPLYLEQGITPHIQALATRGFYKHIKSALPSMTNVNHASILTGSFPAEHGVTGNSAYDAATGTESFVDRSDFLQSRTLFDSYRAQGLTSAIVAVKGKVLQVFGDGADIGINAEDPSGELLAELSLDAPPRVASAEANYWLLEACRQVIRLKDPDLVYCTTNDYIMHNYAPDSGESIEHMRTLDELIGKLYEENPEREIYITADHGMNNKALLVNMQLKLQKEGFAVTALLPMKDRYIDNHRHSEGGTMYLYLQDREQTEELFEWLKSSPYVEEIFTREEAACELGLHPDKIGDFVLFAPETIVYAQMEEETLRKHVRAHGSFHEQIIPLAAVNARRPAEAYNYSLDIGKFILEDQSEGSTCG